MSLEALSFQRSADVLVMLVLGGAGRLYGGLVGSIIFLIARDQFSGIAPQFWYFWIGLLLITVVMLLPNGILGGLVALCMHAGDASERAGAFARTAWTRASARWSSRATSNSPAARRALRADRTERRRQDHADQSDDRHAARPTPDRFCSAARTSPRSTPQQRVKRGLARTFQINTLFADLERARSGDARGCRTAWRCRPVLAEHRASTSDAIDEAHDILSSAARSATAAISPTRELPYGRQRLLEIALALATKPKVLLLDEPAAGVPQEESGDIFEAVASLSDDLTVLFIEHDMHVVFRFATHIIVLVGGAIFTKARRPKSPPIRGVREVYLGTRKHG